MTEKRHIGMVILPWVVMLMTEVFYFHQYYLRVSIGAMGPALTHTLHVSAAALASIAASFYYAYTICQLFCGVLVDRFGIRAMLTTACVLLTLGALLFLVSGEAFWLESARFVMGLGAAFSFVCTITAAKMWFSARAFNLINGITLVIGSLGAMLGTTILNMILKDIGWNEVMLWVTIISLILTLVSWLTVRETPRVAQVRQQAVSGSLVRQLIKPFSQAIRCAQVWWNGLTIGLMFIVVATFVALWCIPFYGKVYPQHPDFAGLAPSLILVGMAVGALAFAALNSMIQKPHWLLRLSALLYLPCVTLALYMTLSVMWVSVLLFLTGFMLGGTCLAFVIVNLWAGDSYRASCVALTNFLQLLMGAAMLPVMGHLFSIEHLKPVTDMSQYSVHEFRMVFLVIVAGAVLALICSLFSRLPKA